MRQNYRHEWKKTNHVANAFNPFEEAHTDLNKTPNCFSCFYLTTRVVQTNRILPLSVLICFSPCVIPSSAGCSDLRTANGKII